MKASASAARPALLLGAIFLVLYGLTSARVWDLPTVFAIDGAELVIASYDLGIDHPPGHPLYLILGFLLTRLPFFSADTGVIAVSVLAGALTVPLLFLGGLELTGRRSAAFLAALSLGLAGIFWLHSAIVEVYAVQLCLLALLTWLQLRGLRRQDPSTLPGVAFAFGLAATSNILLSVLLLPGMFIFLLGSGALARRAASIPAGPDRSSAAVPTRRALLLRAAAALLLGLTPFLYIPWRLSAGTSFVNDLVYYSGYPVQSLTWYAWYLSGWEFLSHKVTAYGLLDYPRLLGQYLEALGRNLSPVSGLLALAGLLWLPARLWTLRRVARDAPPVKQKGRVPPLFDRLVGFVDRHLGPAAFARLAMAALVVAGYLATASPVVGYQVPDREVFYLPSFFFAAYLAGLGAAAVLDRLEVRFRLAGPALIALVVLWCLPVGWRTVVPLTSDRSQYDGHEERFEALPKDAVIIGYDDGHTSRYRYWQLIRGLRPDIAIETFGRHAPRYHGDLPTERGALDEAELRAGLNMADRVSALEKLAKLYQGRPLFLLFRDEAPAEFPGYRVQRAPMDPRLLVLEKKPGASHSAAPIPIAVNQAADAWPGMVRFTGWSIRGLDRGESTAFPQPLQLGGQSIQGLIIRGELFELSFVTQRTGKDNRQYFALFALLDAAGNPIEASELGFVAARQVEVMDADTPPGHFRRDAFDFKVPRAVPEGVATLAVRLFVASDEIVGEYKGRPIRRMAQIEPVIPWRGQLDFSPLGTVLIQ